MLYTSGKNLVRADQARQQSEERAKTLKAGKAKGILQEFSNYIHLAIEEGKYNLVYNIRHLIEHQEALTVAVKLLQDYGYSVELNLARNLITISW